MSVPGPDCVKTRMLRFASAAGWLMKPSLCSDPFYQSANAENAHDPFHVVGQDVSRHFSTDVLECFHLEVRRSHPRLYRAEWMLDGLATKAHFRRVSIEPRLHGLKDGFVLPTRDPPPPCLSCTGFSTRSLGKRWSSSAAVSCPLPHWCSDKVSRSPAG